MGVGALSPRQPPHTALMTFFLLRPSQGRIEVYATKDMQSNVSQATSASGSSDRITMCLVVVYICI